MAQKHTNRLRDAAKNLSEENQRTLVMGDDFFDKALKLARSGAFSAKTKSLQKLLKRRKVPTPQP